MSQSFKRILVLAFVAFFGACSVVLAADQKSDRKRDGSCQSLVTAEGAQTLAADKTRNRKRDRSCQKFMSQDEDLTLAADKTRDRKKDRSCRS